VRISEISTFFAFIAFCNSLILFLLWRYLLAGLAVWVKWIKEWNKLEMQSFSNTKQINGSPLSGRSSWRLVASKVPCQSLAALKQTAWSYIADGQRFAIRGHFSGRGAYEMGPSLSLRSRQVIQISPKLFVYLKHQQTDARTKPSPLSNVEGKLQFTVNTARTGLGDFPQITVDLHPTRNTGTSHASASAAHITQNSYYCLCILQP